MTNTNAMFRLFRADNYHNLNAKYEYVPYNELVKILTEHKVRKEKEGDYYVPMIPIDDGKVSRAKVNIKGRDLLTIDLDDFNIEFNAMVTYFTNSDLKCDFVAHTTHRHLLGEIGCRYRVVIPLSSAVDEATYTRLVLAVLARTGIDATYKANNNWGKEERDESHEGIGQGMYFPSCPEETKDIAKSYFHDTGTFLDPIEYLKLSPVIEDAKTSTSSKTPAVRKTSVVKKQGRDSTQLVPDGDEGEKTELGMVKAAFEMKYNCKEALDGFLSDIYKSKGTDRYGHVDGSKAGVQLLDDNTKVNVYYGGDPAHGTNMGSFELVYKSLFADMDAEDVVYAMAGLLDSPLPFNPKARMGSTMTAVALLADPAFKGIYRDEFGGNDYIPPLSKYNNATGAKLLDDDFIGEACGRIKVIVGAEPSNTSFLKALSIFMKRRQVHILRDKITQLKWDGKPRVSKMMNKYLGCLDDEYSEQFGWGIVNGAIARLMTPGVKFQYMMIIHGEQGLGKSTFVEKLGMGYCRDFNKDFTSKDGIIQNTMGWIEKCDECDNIFGKSNFSEFKNYLGKTEDVYRKPYAAKETTAPRKGIIIGTTNIRCILDDPTGSRRTIMISGNMEMAETHPGDMTEAEVEQIWAEGMAAYKNVSEGKSPVGLVKILESNINLEAIMGARAKYEQDASSSNSSLERSIEYVLDVKVPEDYDTWPDPDRRREFMHGRAVQDGQINQTDRKFVDRNSRGLVYRDYIYKDKFMDEALKYGSNAFQTGRGMRMKPNELWLIVCKVLRAKGWIEKGGRKVIPHYTHNRVYVWTRGEEPDISIPEADKDIAPIPVKGATNLFGEGKDTPF